MSETPTGAPDSGDEGFAPPEGGYGPPPYAPAPTQAPQFGPPPPPPAPGYGPALGHGPAPGYAPPGHGPAPYGYAPQPVPGGYYGPPMLRLQTSGMAVAGMVLGILSMLIFWIWFLGPVLSVLGIIFSSIGLSQCSKPGWTGRGMAIAGLVCSLISLAIWLALAIVIASMLTA